MNTLHVGAGETARYGTLPDYRGSAPFCGRAKDLAVITDVFADPDRPEVLVLHGNPGVGKSRLAVESARTHQARYPGGVFFVSLDLAPPTDLAKLLDVFGLKRGSEEPIEDQCRRALTHLGARPTLLIYDNVPDKDVLSAWLPPEGRVCHVLATSTAAHWPASWKTHSVGLLDDADARALVDEIVRDRSAARGWVDRLVTSAGGITVELYAASRAIDYETQRGQSGALGESLAGDTLSSFGRAWRILPEDAQLVLHSACLFETSRIPPEALRALWIGEGWSEIRFTAALDAALDRTLIAPKGEVLDVHQCVARFVRDQTRLTIPESILRRHLDAFIRAASRFSRQPADPRVGASLRAYPTNVAFWSAVLPEDGNALGRDAYNLGVGLFMDGRFDGAREWFERSVAAREKGDWKGRVNFARLGNSLHQVGCCHSSIGQYEEARRWFERAIAAKEKGDLEGLLDPARMGSSLHKLGICNARTGRNEEARGWFERAVAAKERGDATGHINYESLGSSLHEVGNCHARAGRYDEARGWFERAIAATGKGDPQGHIDFASLGISLHEVGDCHASTGRYDEAREWFDRAIAAKEKGDVHGRVDPESLGLSLHRVGDCCAGTGRYDEARGWFERAIAAKQKGDVHGCVDPGGLELTLSALAALDARAHSKQ